MEYLDKLLCIKAIESFVFVSYNAGVGMILYQWGVVTRLMRRDKRTYTRHFVAMKKIITPETHVGSGGMRYI